MCFILYNKGSLDSHRLDLANTKVVKLPWSKLFHLFNPANLPKLLRFKLSERTPSSTFVHVSIATSRTCNTRLSFEWIDRANENLQHRIVGCR